VSDEGGAINKCMSKIVSFNKLWFSKKYHSGVSYRYVDKNKILSIHNEILTFKKRSYLVIIDKDLYRNAVLQVPKLFVENPCIIYDEKNLKEMDFNGVCSSIVALQQVGFDNCNFIDIISGISAYSDLFFPSEFNSFIFCHQFYNRLEKNLCFGIGV
jgi:hypothetical protein